MASTEYRARISDLGRAHAELHHRCYAELYPDVPAIEPAGDVHAGLVDHQVRRPRGLVRSTDWRLLVALTELEREHRCPWREHVTREYTKWKLPVPAEVPNASYFAEAGSTIPLVCLTDAGRAHVATHAGEYHRLYPDIPP